MPDREFDNINGIKVCDQTARDNIPTKTSQLENDSDYATITQVNQAIDNAQLGGGEVDLSGYVTKETGNANQITFADGQTFQAKLDAGTLKGDKGDIGEQGPQGIQGEQGPKGDTGQMGPQGPAGIDGQDGLTTSISVNGNTYTHVDGVITLPDYPTSTGSDNVDLSNLALSINSQQLSLKNSNTTLSTVTIPTATVTDEQVVNAVQSKIDDGTLSSLKLGTGDVKVENCNFLEGITSFDNLHKKYTTGIGQSVGTILISGSNAISSIIKVKPNRSYSIAITGDHDRFRLSKYNIEGTEITESIKGVNIPTPSETANEFVIDNIGDYNTLVITVSNTSQTPALEVHLVGDGDVDFKFPVKADIVKETAVINGVSILDNTASGECLIDNTVTPYKTTFITEGKNKWMGKYFTGYAIIGAGNGAIRPDTQNYIIAYANIKGDTAYTVSYPNGNEKFRIVELNTEYDFTIDTPPEVGDKLIVSNDSLTEYTFTSSTNAKMLLIYMSDTGKMHDLQIEEGSTKTDYRAYGFKLFDRYIEDITDINMVTRMFEKFIIDKDNSANKFYDCTELEKDSNISKYKHTDIYAMYDELMAANPTYITSEVLGTTTYDNLEVKCYHFIPETLKITNFNADTGTFNTTGTPRIIHGRKRILCLSATHGDERSPVLGLYTFLKDVCENPTNNALLNRVRRELEFIVVPIVNPTGYNNMQRYAKNSEGGLVIDLNRQFTEQLITSDTVDNINNETKLIADLIKANKDTLTAVIDFHNMQPQKGKNLSWFIMDGDDIVKRANQAINKVSPKWQQKYSFLEQDKGFLFGETTNSDIVYPDDIIPTIQRFSHRLGLNSLTLEFTTMLNYAGYNDAYNKQQLNLHLSLIGNLLCEYID